MPSYLLCVSPRSGSTLLCDLLAQTGVAGRPNAFFRPGSIAGFCRSFGVAPTDAATFGQDYIAAAIRAGTGDTGVFGMRTNWDALPGLLDRLRAVDGDGDDLTVLERAFGPCRFVHLARADLVAQAVSLTIAEQTGLWHRNADGSDRENFDLAEVARYDAAQISRELAGLQAARAGWADWFARTAITPLRMTYEGLSADPVGTLAQVLHHIGQDRDHAKRATPGTMKLATGLNADWAARYRTDHGLPPAPTPV